MPISGASCGVSKAKKLSSNCIANKGRQKARIIDIGPVGCPYFGRRIWLLGFGRKLISRPLISLATIADCGKLVSIKFYYTIV